MGSDKQLKPITKFFIYVGVVLGAVLLAVIVCVAILFFKPGTSILGYEYVKYASSKEYEYTTSTSLSLTNVTAIEIATEITDIHIYPNAESDKLKIIHTKKLSGIAKSINADLKVSAQIINKSFEGSLAEYKTLIFNVDEPGGLVSSNLSSVLVGLPTNAKLDVLSIKSNSGNINYNSKSTDSKNTNVVTCTNLHLKTGGVGTVIIDNEEEISNYYITTEYGSVQFKKIEELNANSIKFETGSGLFEYVTREQTAVMNVATDFVVKSSKKTNLGPQIRVDTLNGNLKVDAPNGRYRFKNIGDESNYKQVAITTNNAQINMDEVYAQVSVLKTSESASNSVNIKKLDTGIKTSYFETGSSNAYIEFLTGSASFNSTTGSIVVDNAASASSIWAHSTSGKIDIVYSASMSASKNHTTTIITNTGDVNVENISNSYNIQILENSASSKLNLSFTATAATQNVISSANRNAVITLIGTSNELPHRIVSTKQVTIPQLSTGSAGSEIFSSDNAEYLLNNAGYQSFSYTYRIGYTKESPASYNQLGVTLITTTGTTKVIADVVPEE